MIGHVLLFLPAAFYLTVVNAAAPELANLVLTRVLVAFSYYGLVHNFVNEYLPNYFVLVKTFATRILAARFTVTLHFDVTNRQPQTKIDRLAEENRELLDKLMNMENIHRSTAAQRFSRTALTSRQPLANDTDDASRRTYSDSDEPHIARSATSERVGRRLAQVNEQRSRLQARQCEERLRVDADNDDGSNETVPSKQSVNARMRDTGYASSSSAMSRQSSVFSVHGHVESFTDYSDQDGDDDHNVVIDENAEAQKVEYYEKRLRAIVEEDDPLETYSLKHVSDGGVGKVYKATDIHTGRVIAIKAMSIRESKLLNIILNEVMACRVLRHPNIVDNIGQCQFGNDLCLMMEYCERGCLLDVRSKKSNKRFSENEVAFVMREVLQGLKYIHSMGFIHRDIKAQNLLLTADGQVKIADLGSISLHARAAMKLGTLYWMAPELLANQIYDAKVDIWALAITGIELLEGRPPWYPLGQRRVIELIKTAGIPPLPATLSPELDSFLRTCLEMQPRDRPAAAQLLWHPFLGLATPLE